MNFNRNATMREQSEYECPEGVQRCLHSYFGHTNKAPKGRLYYLRVYEKSYCLPIKDIIGRFCNVPLGSETPIP